MLSLSISKFWRKKVIRHSPLPLRTRAHLERSLKVQEEFSKIARSDAIVVSYEKSGRTWLRVMLSRYYQLRYDLGEKHLLNYDKMHTLHESIPTILFTHNAGRLMLGVAVVLELIGVMVINRIVAIEV